jgi:hypothetical protein
MFERSVARNVFFQVSGRNDTTFTNPVTPQANAKVLVALQERGRRTDPDEWIWRTFMETERVQNLLIYADFDDQRCSYGNGPQ